MTNINDRRRLIPDKHLLNAMLTRHRCGLVIVGDIDVLPSFEGDTGSLKRKRQTVTNITVKEGGQKTFTVEALSGRVYRTNPTMLWEVYSEMYHSGRVVQAPVTPEDASREAVLVLR